VFAGAGVKELGGGEVQDLGEGDQEMEQLGDFGAGFLFVEFLVAGPPFPGDAIGEFGGCLDQRAAVVQGPVLALAVVHFIGVHAGPAVEEFLEEEERLEFVGVFLVVGAEELLGGLVQGQVAAGAQDFDQGAEDVGFEPKRGVGADGFFDVVGDAAKGDFAVIPEGVGGAGVAVLGLADAAGVDDQGAAEAVFIGRWVWPRKRKSG
jgi:hypothetical protein